MISIRTFSGAVVAAVLVASCAGDDGTDGVAPQESASTTAPVTSVDVVEEPVVTEPAPVVIPDGPLVEVCPDPLVVQTTGEPGVAVGPLHQLTGPDAVVAAGAVTGPFTRPDGTVDDITLEIRSGGPATGFLDAVTVASTDDGIDVAHTSVSAMLRRHAESPMVAVAALTDRSHQGIVVDPLTYPDVATVDDLAAERVEIRHFTDSPAFDWLRSSGLLSADQLVDGFGGEPAAFVTAGGAIAQQGDLLVDPALFASLPQWARPVTVVPLDDAGWLDHDDVLAVRSNDLDGLSDCLARVVPIVQQAIVAYAADPSPTNALMAAARADSDPLNRVTAGVLDAGAADAVELEVIGNGDDTTVGDVDVERLAEFVPDLADALDVDPVAVDDLVTEAYVDPTVGL